MQLLSTTQQVTATLKPLDSTGNAAKIDGTPQWTSSNPSVATVEPSGDGMTCLVKAAGVGTTQIGCVADADMDPGETREITILDDLEVKSAEAVTLGMEWGVPEEQGGATPTPVDRGRRSGR